MIINSIANLHNLIYTIDSVITKVAAKFALGTSTVVSDFVSFTAEDELKITADILGLMFALVAAPTWNSWLKGIQVIKSNSNSLGVAKDSVNSMVSNGITIFKDTSTSR